MNRLYTVCFPEENTSVKVSENSTVMEALKKAGIFLDAPCGGQGTCGKCLVSITDSSGTHTKKSLPDADHGKSAGKHQRICPDSPDSSFGSIPERPPPPGSSGTAGHSKLLYGSL